MLPDCLRSHLSGDAGTIEQNVVSVPSLGGQRPIGSVPTGMDAETDALERRLEKTRAIKQGEMQQLCTGVVRLPIPDRLEGASHGI